MLILELKISNRITISIFRRTNQLVLLNMLILILILIMKFD